MLWKGPDPTGHYVLAGRLAPALAFAALVGLVTLVAGRRWGPAAGAAAGFALVAMPRVFAHAHLAALDTFLSLFWTLALVAGDRSLRSQRPVRGAMAGAGALWALALLTKIHAWFLLPILGVWSFVWLPPGGRLRPWLVWSVVGISLFWLGWPWLWYDSWNEAPGILGHGRRAVDDHGRSTSARSSRIATCPGTTPGFTSRRRCRSACRPWAPWGSSRAGRTAAPTRSRCSWPERSWSS